MLTADSSQHSIPEQTQSHRGTHAADAPEASTSAPQGDSPKACWSQVASCTEAGQEPQQGAVGRPRGTSPSDRAGNPQGAISRGQTRPMQVPRSGSSALAATQDGSVDYARTDSASSLNRDAFSERRASGAAAGVSCLLCHCQIVIDITLQG